MLIVMVAGSLVFFAHVPRCAGMAVSEYLTERFGPLAFEDSSHLRRPQEARWSQTSPQHIDRNSLSWLFPSHFFRASFTVVRRPIDRLVSVYHFQRDMERTIPAATEFSDWLADLEEWRGECPFLHDDHVRSMDDLVPRDAAVFLLEDGLDALVAWLDDLGGTVDAPRTIPRQAPRPVRALRPDVTPNAADRALIARLYAVDFERFGYDPDRSAPTALADVAAAAEAVR